MAIMYHFGDLRPVGLTVFLQLVGQGVSSSLRVEEFLCEVSEVLFAFFQLGAQVPVGFQDIHVCSQTRGSSERYSHAEACGGNRARTWGEETQTNNELKTSEWLMAMIALPGELLKKLLKQTIILGELYSI